MNRHVARLLLFLGVVLISALLSVSAAAKTVTLKALTAWPENAFASQQFLKFVDAVQKAVAAKYPGELKIDYRAVIQNKEQVEALRRGLIEMDGYVLPPATIRDFGLIPVSKYMVNPGFYQPCQFVLINLDAWKKIPAHLQELLTEQVKEFAHANIDAIEEELQAERVGFKKEGMNLYRTLPRRIREVSFPGPKGPV